MKSFVLLFALLLSIPAFADTSDGPFFFEPELAVGVGAKFFSGPVKDEYSNTGDEINYTLQLKGYLFGFGEKSVGGCRLLGAGVAVGTDQISIFITPAQFFMGHWGLGPDFYIDKENTHFGVSFEYQF